MKHVPATPHSGGAGDEKGTCPMLTTISPGEMKRVETRVMAETTVTGEELMGRAAGHVAAAVRRHAGPSGPVLALCGTGNNGGDGIAALARLCGETPGMRASVWLMEGTLSPDTARELARLRKDAPQINIHLIKPSEELRVPPDTACVVDALFGTGLSREVTGAAAALCGIITNAYHKNIPVVAVDIPSGLNGETGLVMGAAVRATETVTFHRPKTGLYVGMGPQFTGKVTVCDIGIPPGYDDAAGYRVAQETDMAAFFPPRSPVAHKGSYGRALVVAGSRGMAGAAGLCALAALRTGAGLVTVACPDSIVDTVQGLCPCATCLPLPSDPERAWTLLAPVLAGADALALTYEIFNQLFEHPQTELGIQSFTADYNSVYDGK